MEYDRPGDRSPEYIIGLLMTVTDVLTTCGEVMFRVKLN